MADVYENDSTSKSAKTQQELPEEGLYAARCIQWINLGMQKNFFYDKNDPKSKEYQNKCMIVWELTGAKMEDGRPFVVKLELTRSLNEVASLRKMLEKWRKNPFTPEEAKKFNFSNILDKCCYINVSHSKPDKNGFIYSKVGWTDILPLPNGIKCEPRVNELVDFGINDIGTPEFEKLWPWVQRLVLNSEEGLKYTKTVDAIDKIVSDAESESF